MNKILTVYDNYEPLNNVASVLSLDVDEVFFAYHHDVDSRYFLYIEKVIRKYKKNIKLNFMHLVNDEYQLRSIIEYNENVIVDVGGAKYLSLVLFDLARKNGREIIYYDDEENNIKDYKTHSIICPKVFNLTIEDVINLKGGEIVSYMHQSVQHEDSKQTIRRIVEMNLEHYPAFIHFISRINSFINNADYLGNNKYRLSDDVIRKIESDEIYDYIDDLFVIDGNELEFKNRVLKELVSVSGTFLENYLHIVVGESGYFDDMKMSVVVDFADENCEYPVRCEIDSLILKDNHLLFVSCKSSKADTGALNEIYVHNKKFGNSLSKPVLCVCEELDRKYPSIYAKGKELGVYLIDRSSFLEKDINEEFLSIIEGTYEYDRVI